VPNVAILRRVAAAVRTVSAGVVNVLTVAERREVVREADWS